VHFIEGYTSMTDAQRIENLEREFRAVKAELADLKIAIANATRISAKRGSVQEAVDDLQNSVQLIFKHVHVPGVVYNPDKRVWIEC
jgi:hypothetical protein